MRGIVQVLAGHQRTFLGLLAGLLAYAAAVPLPLPTRAIAAWDAGGRRDAVSFAATVTGFSGSKDLSRHGREWHVGLVALTLLVSWMVMQATFAMRYAHEFYTRTSAGRIDGGLQFPSDDEPDYWDFVYFSVVLGMTFQVSDVQIASRKLRRVATIHGFLGFVFNTVIIASGFLS